MKAETETVPAVVRKKIRWDKAIPLLVKAWYKNRRAGLSDWRPVLHIYDNKSSKLS